MSVPYNKCLGKLSSLCILKWRWLQYVLFDMLNKYFVAQIAENIFIWPGKKVKTGILDYPSPGEIEIKISRLFFFKPTPIFSNAESCWE